MKHLLDSWAQFWHLNATQYWHLRIVSSVILVPLLAVLYLVIRFLVRRRRQAD